MKTSCEGKKGENKNRNIKPLTYENARQVGCTCVENKLGGRKKGEKQHPKKHLNQFESTELMLSINELINELMS